MTRREWQPRGSRQVIRAARELRRHPTAAEHKLWLAVRREQIDGRKFRRQHPVGGFVVDFYCPAAQLVIEVDGEVHGEREQVLHDVDRQQTLESLGLIVLRFRNDDVLHKLPSVLTAIRYAIHAAPNDGATNIRAAHDAHSLDQRSPPLSHA